MEDESPSLLVAMPSLQDPNFTKSVLLLVAHKKEGAVGFVLNRVGDDPLAELVEIQGVSIPQSVPSWFGGPVETSTGIILHNNPGTSEDDLIYDGMSLSSSETTLADLVEHADFHGDHLLYPYRFLVGYAGWGPGQLDDEMQQGAWIKLPANNELIFNCPWQDLWHRTLGSVGIRPEQFAPSQHAFLN